jgi:hypothetical protein
MAASTSKKSRFRTILLITGSLLIVAGAAAGTIFLLKQYGPDKANSGDETSSDNLSPLKKAEDLFAKGDYDGARTQYQSILEDYKAQKNEAGAADIEMQLRVIDATAAAPKEPQNTNRGKVTVGSTPQQ